MCVLAPPAGEVQAFHEDLTGRQHINEVYKLSVDKLYDVLFTESQFMSDFMEQRGISGPPPPLKPVPLPPPRPLVGLRLTRTLLVCARRRGVSPLEEGGDRQPDPGDHVHHLAVQPAGAQNLHRQRDAGTRTDPRRELQRERAALECETL